MAKQSRFNIVLSTVMATLVMGSLVFSSYAYWNKNQAELNIPTSEFNATEYEFTFYACVPNISSTTGYDYYDLEQVPTDLIDDINGLAVVRYEALTKTAYIPSYPKVVIEGVEYNANGSYDLPVIHVLNSLASDDIVIQNGFTKVTNLIIPSTVTYIEPGSFNGATSLTEISVLGDDYSGNLAFSEINFSGTNKEGEPRSLRYQNDSRRTEIKLSDTSSFSKMQFNDGIMQFDNKRNVYSTFVIASEEVNSISLIKTATTDKGTSESSISKNVTLSPNKKYRIDYSRLTDTITVYEYEYKLDVNGAEIPLVLNTNVHHEEYVLNSSLYPFGVINIYDNNDIYVNEYVDSEINDTSSFRLKYLDASYSSNNRNYEVKFAPSLVYISTHYYTSVSNELVQVETQTHISVEKAYFLNTVTNNVEQVKNQEKQVLTIEESSELSIYVKAINSKGEIYTDPNTGSEYIQMYETDSGKGFTFTFLKTLSPSEELPTKYVFYKGNYSIVSLPSYISKSTNENALLEELDYSNSEKVYYFDISGANLHNEDHAIGGQEAEYKWYLAYWPSSGTMQTKELEFISENSDIIRFTVPNGTTKFKFVRLTKDQNVSNALTGNWTSVNKQCYYDINVQDMLESRNNNYMAFHSYQDNNKTKFYVSYANVNPLTNTRRIYLDTNNANFTGEHHTIKIENGKEEILDPEYKWYLIYWKEVNGVEKQYEEPIFYIDDNATSLVVDVPLDAKKFKFARVRFAADIKEALSNNWSGVVNENNVDILLSSLGSNNVLAFNGYVKDYNGADTKQFYLHFKEQNIDKSVTPQTKSYFEISDYCANKNTSYLALDENIGYNRRNATNINKDYAFEFTSFEHLSNGIIQNISLTKGSGISAKILNPFNNTYDTLSFSSSNVSCNSSLNKDEYLGFDDGKVIIEKDISVKYYLKVYYDKTSKKLTSYSLYIDITSSPLNDIERIITRSEETCTPVYDEENIILTGNYPLLTSQSVVKLDRNYANTDYEEYYAYDEEGFNGSYIVSQYSNVDRKYGFGQLNEYYGVYRNDTPLGEYEVSNQTNIKFTPNEETSYKQSYLGAFDEFGNLLTVLDYSANQSLLGGYNIYLGSIPVSGKDYSYVDIKEIGDENTLSSSTTIYVDFANANISQDDVGETPHFQWYVVYWHNDNADRTIEPIYYIKNQGTVMKFELPNDANRFKIVRLPTEYNTSKTLHKDSEGNIDWDGYYFTNYWNNIANQIERDIYPAELSNYNCIQFNGWFEGDPGGRFYFKLTNHNTTQLSTLVSQSGASDNSTLQYDYYFNSLNNNNGYVKESVDGTDTYYTFDKVFVVSTSGYKTLSIGGTAVNFLNNDSTDKLDFAIIDGYTYEGLTIENSNEVKFPSDGYYDLRMLVRNGRYYLGYKFQGNNVTLHTSTFTIKMVVDGVETYSSFMNQTNNVNNYFQDVDVTSKNTTIQILNENSVIIETFVISETGYYRVYASKIPNLSWEGTHYSYTKLSFVNISYDLVEDGASLFEANQYIGKARPFVDTLTSSSDMKYQIKGENIASEVMMIHEGVHQTYIDVGVINELITIYEGDTPTEYSINIPYPGSYLVTFDGTGLRATKVQKPNNFTLVLDGEEIADLVVKEDTKSYYEFTLKEYVVFQEDVYLTSEDKEQKISSLRVVDNSGFTISTIDAVTLVEKIAENDYNYSKVTYIPAGVYQLTYSIDSSRREGSTYYVFTYIKLEIKQQSKVTFTYVDEKTKEEVVVTQVINTYHGTNLYTYKELGGYVEDGKAFIGWAESKTDAVKHLDGEKVKEALTLYPVFKESVHDTIFVSDLLFDSTTDIRFTLSDLGGYNIESVVYSLDDGSKGGYYSNYISIDETTNIVTLKATICELIGYVEGGQEFYVTLSKGSKELGTYKSYTVSVYIPYPKYSSGIIIVPNIYQYQDDISD